MFEFKNIINCIEFLNLDLRFDFFDIQHRMASCKEYTIKYHHGGSLVREGEIRYANGKINEFAVDPDKLCYWDLLGDLNDLGCDIENNMELLYMDDRRALKTICDDEWTAGLCDQLIRSWTVDIFVELSGAKQNKLLPKVLLTGSGNAVEIDMEK